MHSPAKRKMPYHNFSLANFKKRVNRLDKKRADSCGMPRIKHSVMPKYESHGGQTDLEQKSPADERELYKGTASEETTIE